MRPPKGKIVWHYTNGLAIDDIIKAGVIELARAGIGTNEKAAAWFSTNPVWDASANRGNLSFGGKSVSLTKDVKAGGGPVNLAMDDLKEEPFDPEVMEKLFLGRFRIGVVADAAPQGWESFKRLSGIDKQVAASMESSTEYGNVHEWRASFQPVPRKKWLSIEKLVNGVWVTYLELQPKSKALS